MSRIPKTLIVVVALSLPLIILWRWTAVTPEDEVSQRLEELLALVEKDDGESSELARLAAGQKAVRFFSEDCRVQILSGQSELEGREALLPLFLQLHEQAENVELHIWYHSTEIVQDGRRANMLVQLRIGASFPDETIEKGDGEFAVDWLQRNGVWLIERVQRMR